LSCQHAPDRRATPPRGGHERTTSTAGDRDAAAVRSFYEDALQGRQVWPTRRTPADAGLWFLVEGTLIEVRAARDADRPPIALEVDAPDELAARCWDAGFDVLVREDAIGAVVLSVIDPFGREIVLACRESAMRARRLPRSAHASRTTGPEVP
jgi:catechol 2,3-dioxygenase-like lactoylglutathione lyase family enzyme